ncbi:hypothetical protein AVEN_53916-1 [Araneus ventricosus]|uniref:Uncharacterized protein n=1 Tax=Araneus ventricosus TaxID=182803 RepID=A0A4Y2IEG2_ARAVE|nr:hypothetical protein AVEN_53916-1 [Araneus ventricosus]
MAVSFNVPVFILTKWLPSASSDFVLLVGFWNDGAAVATALLRVDIRPRVEVVVETSKSCSTGVESKFNIFGSDRRIIVWRRKMRNLVGTVKYGGGGVLVWGCISASGLANLNCDIIPMSAVYFAKMSEKKERKSGMLYKKRKARIAAENEKQASILKKFIKIENIESREGLSTTVEDRSLTSENFENDNITYCSNQEQEVSANSTPQVIWLLSF